MEPDGTENIEFSLSDEDCHALQDAVNKELEWCREYIKDDEDPDEFLTLVAAYIDSTLTMMGMNYDGISGKKRDRKDRETVQAIRRSLEKLSQPTIRGLWTLCDRKSDSEKARGERRLEINQKLITDCDVWLKYVSTDKQVKRRWPQGLVNDLFSLVDRYTSIKPSYAEDSKFVRFHFQAIRCAFGNDYPRSTVRNWVKELLAKKE